MSNPSIIESSTKLKNHIKNINYGSITLSDYYADQLKYYDNGALERYSHILSCCEDNTEDITDRVFIDYGGGLGLMSMLAKIHGYGTVVYNDLFEEACQDAETIGKSAGYPADYYVSGDVDQLIKFLESKNMRCDVLASYDVLEHIYDIEYYLERLKDLPRDPHYRQKLVMCSGANQYNPYIRRVIVKRQIRLETAGRIGERVVRSIDNSESYYQMRVNIIQKHAPGLKDETVTMLARATRGMIKDDILQLVDDYLSKRVMLKTIEHPSNTCDPLTGNWEEHLMNPYYLSDILNKNGFTSKVYPGRWYYSGEVMVAKKLLYNMINLCMIPMGSNPMALRLSYFYMLHAVR